MKVRGALFVTLIVVLLVGACRPPQRPTPEATDEVDAAIADLAADLEVDESAIEVVSVEKRNFPDTSLGVPEPGEMYAQVVTPGYIIILEVDGETYEYHASEERVVRAPQLE